MRSTTKIRRPPRRWSNRCRAAPGSAHEWFGHRSRGSGRDWRCRTRGSRQRAKNSRPAGCAERPLRTCLTSTNSLIYRKIQGNSPVIAPPCLAGVKFPIAHQPEAAVFPTQGNRELFIRNREFRDGNRDGRGIFPEDFRVKAPGPRGASIEGATHASVL